MSRSSGHPDHAFTQGHLCGETYRFPERVYGPERQLHPLKRSNGRPDGAGTASPGTRRSNWWRRRSADYPLTLVTNYIEKWHVQLRARWPPTGETRVRLERLVAA